MLPWVSAESIHEAFLFCAEAWPHGGGTNRDFQIAVKYLKLNARYSDIKEPVGSLVAKNPAWRHRSETEPPNARKVIHPRP